MNIDWKSESVKYHEDFLRDLKTMLKIESVRDDSQATDDAPLGPGPKEALQAFLQMAEKDGFEVHNIDNLVGYIEYGPKDAKDYVAVLGHLDVMPAGEGWETDPFEPVVTDDKIIARGSSDDKGPTMSAYYALKMLVDKQVELKHRIRLIVGTDEENNWVGMKRYFEVEPQPIFGFSPDAEYPIINGEKGNIQVQANFAGTNGQNVVLNSFDAGMRTNMVPGVARATVTGLDFASVAEEFKVYLANNDVISGEIKDNGQNIDFILYGKQVHGAMPETGENAGTYLATFLNNYDFENDAKDFLKALELSHDTPYAEKLGLDITDDVMGQLTMNVGIQKFNIDGKTFINWNFRYPKGITAEDITKKMQENLNNSDAEVVNLGHAMPPHYVAADDAVVTTLLDVYASQSGYEAHDQVIGGGTYGRLMDRGVAFGALFPDSPDKMHQVNEFAMLRDLYISISIYAEGMYRLANLD